MTIEGPQHSTQELATKVPQTLESTEGSSVPQSPYVSLEFIKTQEFLDKFRENLNPFTENLKSHLGQHGGSISLEALGIKIDDVLANIDAEVLEEKRLLKGSNLKNKNDYIRSLDVLSQQLKAVINDGKITPTEIMTLWDSYTQQVLNLFKKEVSSTG